MPIKSVIGISNSNAPDVTEALRKLKPRTYVHLLGYDPPEKLKEAKIIVASSVNSVKSNAKVLNKTDAFIFVVDIAINLKRIRGIFFLDCRLTYDLGAKFYDLSTSMLNECLIYTSDYKYKTLKFREIDVAEKLLDKTPTSVLSKIMTFLYSIPDKKKRELYKQTIFKWMVTPSLTNDFLITTLKLKGKSKRLIDFLASPQIAVVRSLFEHGADTKKIMRENKVASFDFNYLKRVKKSYLKGKNKKSVK